MSTHLNPYIAGNPVKGEEQFIGRTDVLREVEKVLRNPSTNAIVLFGQRRIGKTSILSKIEQQLNDKAEYTPIYFDLVDKASKSLSEVLYEMAHKISTITKSPMPEQKEFDEEGDFFRGSFISDVVKFVNNKGLVLLLDEFDVLDSPKHNQAGTTFFPLLTQMDGQCRRYTICFCYGAKAGRTFHQYFSHI